MAREERRWGVSRRTTFDYRVRAVRKLWEVIESLVIRVGSEAANLPAPRCREEVRAEAKLRLADLALLLAVDVSTISRWERGLVEPRGAARLMYAALLTSLSNEDTPPVAADDVSRQSDGAALHGAA